MRAREVSIRLMIACVTVVGFGTRECRGQRKIELEPAAEKVGRYEKLEMQVRVGQLYENPFDPEQVEVTVVVEGPGNERIVVPGFYCQEYERREFGQGGKKRNWYYPVGDGTWKVRFAPTATGTYEARARLKDSKGHLESQSVLFACTDSQRKGFLRAGRKDPRFLEFTEGGGFFAIGQNLAFVGEGQYVNLSKAEEIFGRLSRNGANFLRIWTCCEDWALAIEAKKSAWDRSWGRNAPIVTRPGEQAGRKCVKIEGGDGRSLSVSPSHPVGLRPGMRYVLTGEFTAEGAKGLRVEAGGSVQVFEAGDKGRWRQFRREFESGENELWLGRVALGPAGSGTVWVDRLSLKEGAGGAELLWEAEVNRPVRGRYNQVDCFMLDKLVEAAEENGIYLMLCLITRDLYMNSLSDQKSPEYGQAIKDARKLMRYAVARWGYSTNVAAWEYFNEMDPGRPTDRFYDEVGEYLEQVDIYHHLRTTSTWHPSARDCRHGRLDIGQLHHYMRPVDKENFRDEVAVIEEKAAFLREHGPGKPVLIGEFGLATEKWGLSENMKKDSDGVHFHNCLWASAFSGVSGTAMFWWWDQLDRQDAYGHYRPLAEYLADVSFAGMRKIRATASDERVRVQGYQGEGVAYFWVCNREATWWNVVIERREPGRIKGASLEIEGLGDGDYSLEWWDTREGKVAKRERASSRGGKLRVSVPEFAQDIACKVKR
jgi:hypothetical protein